MASVSHRIWLIFLLLAWAPLPALTEGAASSLGAHVTVQSVLRLAVLTQPANLAIGADDIARGYIDLDDATVLQVRSNSRSGYLLAFQNHDPLITAVVVKDGERTTWLSPAGGMLHYGATDVAQGRTSVLSYRLFLSERAAPGSHAWPLQLEALID